MIDAGQGRPPAARGRHRAELTAMLAVGGGLLLLALLLAVTLDGGRPLALDSRVLAWVLGHRSASSVSVARAVTTLGSSPVAWGGLLAATALALVRGRRGVLVAVVPLLALGLGQALRSLLAETVGRARPPLADRAAAAAGHAFPSGHTTTAVLAWGLVLLVLCPATAARRALGIVAVAAVGIAVGLSRVWLGVHWLSDVLAGWACGSALLALALVVLRRAQPRAPTISDGV